MNATKTKNSIEQQEQLQKVQQIGQEILDVFVTICENNGLRYYLIAGTLLGAVRHKGPIPWDDDIDVAMPRRDLEIFKRLMQKAPLEQYPLHCYETDRYFRVLQTRLNKKGTLYKLEHELNTRLNRYEVWIDIFPLDNAPDEQDSAYIRWGKRLRMWKRLLENRVRTYSGMSVKASLAHTVVCLLPISFFRRRLDKMMRRWEQVDTGYYVSWASHYDFQKQTMPKAWYEPVVRVEYSGKQYDAPGNWDAVLTQLYGDYMTPPEESARSWGHGAVEVEL